MKYITDSNGSWKYGYPIDYLDNSMNIQLLIHPIWWNDTTMTKTQAYKKFIKEMTAAWEAQFRKDERVSQEEK